MAEYEYVRRKCDGLYVSVDGGFTANREHKAFVFYEGCAGNIGYWMQQPEYIIVPLDPDQIAEFLSRVADRPAGSEEWKHDDWLRYEAGKERSK